jgi:hypothetical protein
MALIPGLHHCMIRIFGKRFLDESNRILHAILGHNISYRSANDASVKCYCSSLIHYYIWPPTPTSFKMPVMFQKLVGNSDNLR